MTKHISDRIEKIIFSGGFVNDTLSAYINELSEIRHPSSIEREFDAAFKHIESRKGSVHPSNKKAVKKAIEKVWGDYPQGEKELYSMGITVQHENGVQTTKVVTF